MLPESVAADTIQQANRRRRRSSGSTRSLRTSAPSLVWNNWCSCEAITLRRRQKGRRRVPEEEVCLQAPFHLPAWPRDRVRAHGSCQSHVFTPVFGKANCSITWHNPFPYDTIGLPFCLRHAQRAARSDASCNSGNQNWLGQPKRASCLSRTSLYQQHWWERNRRSCINYGSETVDC